MSTIECEVANFNEALCFFMREIGNTSNTQDQIGNAYKGLVLHYLGINGSDEEIEKAAMILEVATSQALRRGWTLERPEGIGE